MLGGRLQGHQVHHVDHADAQVGNLFAQQTDRSEGLQRGHVAAAGHHHLRSALVIRGPRPHTQSSCAVSDCLVDGEPLRLGLLAGHNQVNVMAAAQAVIRHREQRVGVRRQIDANHIGLLVHQVVDEAGVLVAEAVVVLPPNQRTEQVIEAGDGLAPGNPARHLEPFGVLIRHRVDDVDECFITGEEAMAAGEQIAFKPALAHVLAEDLHHPASFRQVLVHRQRLGHPCLAGAGDRVLQAV